MTSFARKVLVGAARYEPRGSDEQLHPPAGVHRGLGQGRRQSRRSADAEPLAVRPLRLPQSHDRRSAEHPAAIRRRRQRAHLRPQPAVRSRPRRGRRQGDRCSKRGFGYSWTQAGKNPPALGSDSAFDQFGLPGLPTDSRIAGGLPTQLINGLFGSRTPGDEPAVAVPDRLQPENQLHVDDRGALLQDRLRVSADQHRSAGRQPALRPRHLQRPVHRPTGAASANIYNLADFMLGLRAQYALSSVLVANLRRNMQFAYLQDDWRAGSRLTLNLGVRYEYSTPYWERDNILSNFDPATNTMVFAKDGSIGDRALVNPDRNNFGPRLGFAYTVTPGMVVRGGYGVSYVHFSRAGGGDLLPINGPAGRQRGHQPDRSDCAVVRAGGARISGGTRRSVPVQPADREHHLHAERLPLESGAELVHLRAARAEAQHAARRRLRRQSRRRPAALRQLQSGVSQQRGRHHSAPGSAAESEPSPTSPTRSTAASRDTRRCRRSSNGG